MLSKNIARLRKARGLTQVELAKTLHVTQSAVSHWESGRSVPDTVQLFQIAEFFGTSVDAMKAGSSEYSTAKENKSHPTAEKNETIEPQNDSIISAIAKLSPENRALVEQMALKLLESQQHK